MILRLLCAKLWMLLVSRKEKERMMSKVYFNRLIVGTITFDAIPSKYQDAVRQYGIEWVQSGKMSVDEYEMLYKEEYPVQDEEPAAEDEPISETTEVVEETTEESTNQLSN